MHILILVHNKPKANSYGENTFQSLLSYYADKNFSIINVETLGEANQHATNENNTVSIVKAGKGIGAFFNGIQLRSLLKKKGIEQLIQITEEKIIEARLPQLIISGNADNLAVPKSISSFITIAVSSQHTKQIIKEKGFIQEQNIVVLPAIANLFYQPISWSDKQSLKVEQTQGREYFFVYANGKSKTSFLSLLKAFSAFKKWQHSSMKLVVEGNLLFSHEEDWIEKFSTYKYRDDVVFINNSEEEESARLLAGAYAFIHTPKGEDDILPLLQAMKCETPCISFSTEIIKEYAGNAAILIEDEDYERLGEKMILLYKDETLRAGLINEGNVQTKIYSKERVTTLLNNILPKSDDDV